jgi:hypothetical protein
VPEEWTVEAGVGRGFVGKTEEVSGWQCGEERLRTLRQVWMVLRNLSGEAAGVAGIVEVGVWCRRCRRRCEKAHGWRGNGGPTQGLEVVRGEAAVSL